MNRYTSVKCAAPGCERRVPRKARQQRYCSKRCRQRGGYANKVARGDFSIPTTALPTEPPKNSSNYKKLQGKDCWSGNGIRGPRRVLDAEIVGGRQWREVISIEGVRGQIAYLNASVLVGVRR